MCFQPCSQPLNQKAHKCTFSCVREVDLTLREPVISEGKQIRHLHVLSLSLSLGLHMHRYRRLPTCPQDSSFLTAPSPKVMGGTLVGEANHSLILWKPPGPCWTSIEVNVCAWEGNSHFHANHGPLPHLPPALGLPPSRGWLLENWQPFPLHCSHSHVTA